MITDLGLELYDFGPRQYDPWALHTTTMDPMAEMFYSLSPYSWAGGNPLRYVDPTGMVIEDGSKKEWDKQKGNVESRRDNLQGRMDKLSAKAEAKGWSAEKLASKTGNLTERVSSLTGSLKTMGTLEGSSQVYSLQKVTGSEGGTTYDSKTGNVVIGFGSTANFVHETTHAGQFESGDIAFDTKSGQSLGQDVHDEVAGYKAQFAYDPSSVSQLPASSVANSFGAITPSWVQGVTGADGSKIYAPGGSSNTGMSPVNINTNRNGLMQAYPHIQGLGNFPSNYTLKSRPGTYYKRP